MTMTERIPEFPKRLIDGDGSAAELIRASLAERVRGPSEARSWHLLRDRVDAAPQRRRLVLALGGVCCVLAVLVGLRAAWPGGTPSVGAEAWSKTPPGKRSATAATAVTAPSVERPPARLESAPSPKSDAHPLDAHPDPARCAALAHDGRYEAAADCYDRIAHGRSMAAELALYEKARLESRALGRGEAALATLEEHGRRFPHGVLASEVGITRIELLIRLGRADTALGAIEQALKGPLGQERPGDLLALKGDLLSARGDCAAALAALAGAREAGVHGSRLEAGEKRCAAPSGGAAETPSSKDP